MDIFVQKLSSADGRLRINNKCNPFSAVYTRSTQRPFSEKARLEMKNHFIFSFLLKYWAVNSLNSWFYAEAKALAHIARAPVHTQKYVKICKILDF